MDTIIFFHRACGFDTPIILPLFLSVPSHPTIGSRTPARAVSRPPAPSPPPNCSARSSAPWSARKTCSSAGSDTRSSPSTVRACRPRDACRRLTLRCVLLCACGGRGAACWLCSGLVGCFAGGFSEIDERRQDDGPWTKEANIFSNRFFCFHPNKNWFDHQPHFLHFLL